MSKVDALRALREARYAQLSAQAAPKATRAPATRASTPRAVPASVPAPQQQEPQADATCGHRNMSGRACTREADHLKAGTKNHRYS